MPPARTYRMTIASVWYDKGQPTAHEYEMHFKSDRRADITKVREELRRRGIEYFQRSVYRQTGRWIPKHKIKARFESETPTVKAGRRIGIESRRMEYRGREWKAHELPSRVIGYAKRKYRRRIIR